jgi:zinc transport system permease protein
MFDDFMVRAALAGVGIAFAAAPLGCFVVWRKMAYFGDATAHAAVLGVSLSLLFSLPMFASVLAVTLVMASLVVALHKKNIAMDTLLGVTAHSSLAIGLVAASFATGVRIDLMAYLFGDILAVSKSDLLIIWLGALAILILLIKRWSALLLSTLSPDLASSYGFSPKREQWLLTWALAIMVALAIKVVGALLIVAMLVIPAAAARVFSKTPEQMALVATVFGICASVLGLQGAFSFDTPTGPTIVCTLFIIFSASSLLGILKKQAPNKNFTNNQ